MTKIVGVVGLGIMGGAMAANLLKEGFEVFGFDLDADKNAAVADAGGTILGSPKEVAEKAGRVIISLPSMAALDAVCTGPDGLIAAGRTDLIAIETGTFPIEDKERNHKALGDAGMILLDCPLSGTGAQARNKDLSIYASGDKGAADKCQDIFDGFGRSTFYVGEFGNGSKMKYVANLLVSIHNVSSAEAFLLGMKSGLDAQMIYDVIKDGAGNSRMFEVRGPMMVANNYDDATMTMQTWKKDMSVILSHANAVDCPTPLLNACDPIYVAARAQGRHDQDTAGVLAVLEELADFKRSE
ncbi:MAG: NAD(P)-dependent oxidoreductase [Rhodospirillaceae bacterium]|nr:NAD(P)-dependent oxidoreductase [Rhodospirillales bacterium]MBT3905278.1 NAD(P)-dependent oxidoreductase [Rhodospirillaceae bacterium]MBT4700553.1 NAD(P)-dependent oxidoreductase [Rhodospirillaceae bacterium]MBT5034507.1 NAD(P)-dependent oxidoreductase [Rhodospirillaceae bacterium]MBT6218457.1 NAD(P)-dependent oxidoreductase [Rhodospirillaceae bacterium]